MGSLTKREQKKKSGALKKTNHIVGTCPLEGKDYENLEGNTQGNEVGCDAKKKFG